MTKDYKSRYDIKVRIKRLKNKRKELSDVYDKIFFLIEDSIKQSTHHLHYLEIEKFQIELCETMLEFIKKFGMKDCQKPYKKRNPLPQMEGEPKKIGSGPNI